MEKIIFLAITLPILGFVFYLGAAAIMKGFKAKVENKPDNIEEKENEELSGDSDQLSNEISKLNELFQKGVLTQEEFEKAKKKILNN